MAVPLIKQRLPEVHRLSCRAPGLFRSMHDTAWHDGRCFCWLPKDHPDVKCQVERDVIWEKCRAIWIIMG